MCHPKCFGKQPTKFNIVVARWRWQWWLLLFLMMVMFLVVNGIVCEGVCCWYMLILHHITVCSSSWFPGWSSPTCWTLGWFRGQATTSSAFATCQRTSCQAVPFDYPIGQQLVNKHVAIIPRRTTEYVSKPPIRRCWNRSKLNPATRAPPHRIRLSDCGAVASLTLSALWLPRRLNFPLLKCQDSFSQQFFPTKW